MTKPIYGWHIVHKQTGLPYAFCARLSGGIELTEEDILADFENKDDWQLIALVMADSIN